MKVLLVSAVFVVSLTVAAAAQTEALAPVDTLSCEQMQAELIVAGQTMNAQMDPEFAREAQAMHDEAQQRPRANVGASIGTSLACSLPGVGMACMAGQAAQAQQAQGQANQHIERMQAQNDRLNASMAGLDQERLMALSQRFEEQGCQTPQ